MVTTLSCDEFRSRLDAFERRLQSDLMGTALVERVPLGADDDNWIDTSLTPTNTRALGLSWIWNGELILQSNAGGGARWELTPCEEDLALLERIVQAVVAGRVTTVAAFGRDGIFVTPADGQVEATTCINGCLSGLIPQIGWTHWGRTRTFEPYADASRTEIP